MKTKTKSNQKGLVFPEWGGRRKGAGRKREGVRARVPHRRRPALASRFPVHVTMRLCAGLPNLRKTWTRDVVVGAIAAARERFGVRLIHFSVQTNHIHLIVEGRDKAALSRAMQGLGVRLAKRLNKEWGRSGTVFADRYHAHILRARREVRNAVRYVLENAHKHGLRIAGVDPASSAHPLCASAVARARTWLLTKGLQLRGAPG